MDTQETKPGPSFEDSAHAVMDGLRRSLAAMTEALPEPVHRAIDVERVLGLDKKLAWQIYRLANSTGVGELANMPPRTSTKRVLEAARRARVPIAIVERVSRSFNSFDEFALTHGGDREGVISMVSALDDEQGGQFDLKVRKSRFRADTHIWGVQARMQVDTGIWFMHPGELAVHDLLILAEDIDLRRTRQSGPLTIPRWVRTQDDSAMARETAASSAGEAPTIAGGLDLIPEYCSHPLPKMTSVLGQDGRWETEIQVPPGRTGAVTLCSRQLHQHTTHGPQTHYRGNKLFSMPVESAVFELLIPVGWSDPTTARAVVYGRRAHPEQVTELRPCDRLPQRETVVHLGVMECAPRLDGNPHHDKAVRHVLQEYGWLGTLYDVYRCRVQYPVLHSLLGLSVDPIAR